MEFTLLYHHPLMKSTFSKDRAGEYDSLTTNPGKKYARYSHVSPILLSMAEDQSPVSSTSQKYSEIVSYPVASLQ
jgi:hypothetical protein